MPEIENRNLWRRLPAPEKNISEIQDSDMRIRIIGTIIDLTDSSLLIDDGTGKIEIDFDSPEQIAGLSQGQLVRVLTRVMPLIDGYTCKGECIQILDGFDLKLYKQVKEIIKR